MNKIIGKNIRIHIFGASGSGTTKLGKALSKVLSIPFFDFDDYYWQQTDPPYTKKRETQERYDLLICDLQGLNSYIISGHYGVEYKPLDDMLTHVIFLYVPAKVRQQRIRNRDFLDYGDRILKGGDMYDEHEAFVEWAGHYDLNDMEGRKLEHHQLRIKQLKCPVIKVEGDIPVKQAIDNILDAIK